METMRFRCPEILSAISSGKYSTLQRCFKNIPIKKGMFIETYPYLPAIYGHVVNAVNAYVKTAEYAKFRSEFGEIRLMYEFVGSNKNKTP